MDAYKHGVWLSLSQGDEVTQKIDLDVPENAPMGRLEDADITRKLMVGSCTVLITSAKQEQINHIYG
jgi:hypothetical protein